MSFSKRLFDLIIAALLALVLLPILAILLAVMLVVEGRPFFYISERMRSPSRGFNLYKLRSMRLNDGSDQGVSGGDKTDRITKFGHFLRRTRLDEIPQLWNVFRGDMSFVGPRPPLRQYVEKFPELYGQVLASRPGITGLATLHYHRHEERLLAACTTPEQTDAVYCARCIPAKARIDLIYQRRRNLCFDLWLMLRTGVKVLG